jgi:hypothetical protein
MKLNVSSTLKGAAETPSAPEAPEGGCPICGGEVRRVPGNPGLGACSRCGVAFAAPPGIPCDCGELVRSREEWEAARDEIVSEAEDEEGEPFRVRHTAKGCEALE